MKHSYAAVGFATAMACSLAGAATAQSIVKSPDQGPYWQPLSALGGTYVYADSFVAPTTETVTSIGIWLTNYAGDTSAQPVVFEVLGSSGGGPDGTNVLATTGVLTLDVTNSLSLYTESTVSSDTLVAGDTYWVAGSEVGLSGGGYLRVGGHTQNSGGIVDGGTFWYSNDPNGVNFDGQALTPEMAFTLNSTGNSTGAVPEPATWALMLIGFGGVGAAMRSRRRIAATATV